MASYMRLCIIMIALIFQNGCNPGQSKSIPVLPPIAKITASLRDVPEFSLEAVDLIVVPEDQVATFAKLVLPTRPCQQQIHPERSYHVADVLLDHSDGTKTGLIIRWTGHNPAAVSIDGRKYYYGGRDEFPDGATRIMRLLGEYDFNSRTLPSKSLESEPDQSSKLSPATTE